MTNRKLLFKATDEHYEWLIYTEGVATSFSHKWKNPDDHPVEFNWEILGGEFVVYVSGLSRRHHVCLLQRAYDKWINELILKENDDSTPRNYSG